MVPSLLLTLMKTKSKLNFKWDQLASTGQLDKLYYKTQNWELYQLISLETFMTMAYNCAECALHNSTQPRRGTVDPEAVFTKKKGSFFVLHTKIYFTQSLSDCDYRHLID